MPGKLKLSEIVPRYKLTQKKYKFIVEVLKRCRSGCGGCVFASNIYRGSCEL